MAKNVTQLIQVAPQYQVRRGAVKHESGLQTRYLAAATFDPSANTGERTVDTHGLGVYIPDNAIVTKAWIDVITTCASAGADAGTIAVQIQAANDVVAAIAISDASNVWDAGLRGSKIGVVAISGDAETALVATAANAANMLKLTAEREIAVVVGGQALTAGKFVVYAEYVIGA